MDDADQVPIVFPYFKDQFEGTPIKPLQFWIDAGKVVFHKAAVRIGCRRVFQRVAADEHRINTHLRGLGIIHIKHITVKIFCSGTADGISRAVIKSSEVDLIVRSKLGHAGLGQHVVAGRVYGRIRGQCHAPLGMHQFR